MSLFLSRDCTCKDLGNGFFYFPGFACQLPEIHFYDSHLFIKRGPVKRNICPAVKFPGITTPAFYDMKSGFVEFMGQAMHSADHWSKVVKAAPVHFEQRAGGFLGCRLVMVSLSLRKGLTAVVPAKAQYVLLVFARQCLEAKLQERYFSVGVVEK